MLRAIQDEREARRAQEMRREKYEAAETTSPGSRCAAGEGYLP
ncbi:hypothetical protein [Klebsiella pneumoniae]|nr:hypothetical protein [Klebsiella pneumoniae]